MKKTLIFALTAALAIPAAFAEDTLPAGKPMGQMAPGMMAPGMMDPEGFAEHLDDRVDLGLSDDQKQKIQALMQAQRTKHDAIRAETRQQMDGILTPEQRQKLDAHKTQMMEMREQRREMRDERRDGRRDGRADGKKDKCDEKAKQKKRFWKKTDSE